MDMLMLCGFENLGIDMIFRAVEGASDKGRWVNWTVLKFARVRLKV